MGQIQTFTTEDGKTVRAYIPDNVSEDTPILHYSYLLGSSVEYDTIWQGYEEAMIAQNPNSIIIIPENPTLVVGYDDPASHLYQSEVLESINVIKNEYEIQSNTYCSSGWSAGFGFAVRSTAHYIEQNPDAGRQVLIGIDGIMNDSTCIQQSELQTLADNNTILISYSQPQLFDYQVRKLGPTNLPILFIVDPILPEYSAAPKYWEYHNYVTENFFDSGLYEDVINFVNGKGELPTEFSYKVYDPKTGEIREINREEVANFLGIEEFLEMEPFTFSSLSTMVDYELKSSNSVLTTHLNNIKNNILNASILSSSWGEDSYNSTTKVPSEIPSITSQYFQATSELLTKLANDIFEFAKASISIEELNKMLENAVQNLNEETVVVPDESTNNQQNPMNDLPNASTILTTIINSGISNIIPNTENDNSNNSTISINNSINIPTPDTGKDIIQSNNNDINITPPNTDNINNPPNTNNNNSNNQVQPIEGDNKVETNEEYIDYDSLYSDENKIVLEYIGNNDDKYKIIIYKDENDKVTGIEHYYEFKTTEEATSEIQNLREKYGENEFVDGLIQNENRIRIIFNKEMYTDLNVTEIKEKYYNELEEVLSDKE